ncbi:MAG: ribosomal small subunit methyltransferase [Candidatus Parcubacteria bacterium]|jgi:16S rRNA (cytosine1402-N4)-methyltransferase
MHIPVLLHESLEGLAIQADGIYVDCTTNRAGHSYELAQRLSTSGTLVCIDLDQHALDEAKQKLATLSTPPAIHFVHSNFRHLQDILAGLGIEKVNGVLADLGLSSQELDSSGRGFSFRFDEPLQMTFDADPSEEATTAYDIVNFWSESTIADVLYGFADETYSRRIAHAILERRKEGEISTTHQLVDVIAHAVPVAYRHRKTHFATKTFQALRMAVNDELGSIQDLLHALPTVLIQGGRASIITFHSTEDRIVKQTIRSLAPMLSMVNKKAIIPQEEESKNNPRSRSAQLRIAERL